VSLAVPQVTEPVTADHRPCLQHHPAADPAAGITYDPGSEHRVFPHHNAIAQRHVLSQSGPGSQPHVLSHDGEGAD
jgi:hypothetical protein